LEFSGQSHFVLPKGTTAQRPTGVAAGSMRFNTDTKLVEQYNGVEWVTLNSYGVGRGIFTAGYTPAYDNRLDYVTISTTGNASYFGDLTVKRSYSAACSSSTRGVFGNGWTGSASNTIDYITIATTGNATDFGDTSGIFWGRAGCSSSTRGVFGGGEDRTNPTYILNTIDYITIATTGNATDFGDLTYAGAYLSSCSSNIRGIFAGGYYPIVNVINYITIATTGNATDFGDLTVIRKTFSACSSSTRGVFGGGITPGTPADVGVSTIDYTTIASTSNAASFGTLTTATQANGSCSSSIRGLFGGGETPGFTNVIEYITIANIGNALDFGDLTYARSYMSACSDSHGGLQ
jgi:hypothetical protein